MERNGAKMSHFHFRKHSMLIAIIGFAMVALLGLGVIGVSVNHSPYQDTLFFRSADEVIKFSEGWTIIDGDKTYETSMPSRRILPIESDVVILKNTLPEELPYGASLGYASSLQRMKVYVDGELVYDYGDPQYILFGDNPGPNWNMIPLENAEGKALEVEFTNYFKDFRNHFLNFYIGSELALVSMRLREHIVNFFFIFVTVFVGVSLLIYYSVLRVTKIATSKQMLYMSLMAIFVGMWEFSESKLTQLFVGNSAGYSSASFIFMALMLVPIIFYIDELEKNYYHKVMFPVEIILELNVAFQTLGYCLGWFYPYNTMMITHVLILIEGIVCLITLFLKYRKFKDNSLLIFFVALSMLIVAAIIEILTTYIKGYVPGGFMVAAVMLVMIVTGIESVRSTLGTIQESKRAVQENAAKSTFLANMSHEIRTPMNAICAMSELLMNADELNAGSRDFANTIHSSAENLLDIINDILDFSKITADKYDIIDEEYELLDLVSDVREISALRAEKKNLTFEIDVNPEIPYELYGDISRIRQILFNIVNNAIKYTNYGRVSLYIDFVPRENNTIELVMRVTDTGIGIKAEDMEGLFEAFVQVDRAKNRSKEGTGLGLAISQAIAQMMGGKITVSSEYGKGSVFTATVMQTIRSDRTYERELLKYYSSEKVCPLVLVESDFETTGKIKAVLSSCNVNFVTCREEEVAQTIDGNENPVVVFSTSDHPILFSREFKSIHPNVRAIGIAGSLEKVDAASDCEIIRYPLTSADLSILLRPRIKKSKKISFAAPNAKVLVVDDNVVNLRVMKEMLKKYDIKATVCSSGTQAVAAMKIKNFDMIFMDHMMPEMDGIEATRLIRELPEIGKRVRIVVLTANAVKGMDKVYKESGFDAFLEKPTSLNDVSRVLQKYLPKELINEIEG